MGQAPAAFAGRELHSQQQQQQVIRDANEVIQSWDDKWQYGHMQQGSCSTLAGAPAASAAQDSPAGHTGKCPVKDTAEVTQSAAQQDSQQQQQQQQQDKQQAAQQAKEAEQLGAAVAAAQGKAALLLQLPMQPTAAEHVVMPEPAGAAAQPEEAAAAAALKQLVVMPHTVCGDFGDLATAGTGKSLLLTQLSPFSNVSGLLIMGETGFGFGFSPDLFGSYTGSLGSMGGVSSWVSGYSCFSYFDVFSGCGLMGYSCSIAGRFLGGMTLQWWYTLLFTYTMYRWQPWGGAGFGGSCCAGTLGCSGWCSLAGLSYKPMVLLGPSSWAGCNSSALSYPYTCSSPVFAAGAWSFLHAWGMRIRRISIHSSSGLSLGGCVTGQGRAAKAIMTGAQDTSLDIGGDSRDTAGGSSRDCSRGSAKDRSGSKQRCTGNSRGSSGSYISNSGRGSAGVKAPVFGYAMGKETDTWQGFAPARYSQPKAAVSEAGVVDTTKLLPADGVAARIAENERVLRLNDAADAARENRRMGC
jgi:hypothetical protein